MGSEYNTEFTIFCDVRGSKEVTKHWPWFLKQKNVACISLYILVDLYMKVVKMIDHVESMVKQRPWHIQKGATPQIEGGLVSLWIATVVESRNRSPDPLSWSAYADLLNKWKVPI